MRAPPNPHGKQRPAVALLGCPVQASSAIALAVSSVLWRQQRTVRPWSGLAGAAEQAAGPHSFVTVSPHGGRLASAFSSLVRPSPNLFHSSSVLSCSSSIFFCLCFAVDLSDAQAAVLCANLCLGCLWSSRERATSSRPVIVNQVFPPFCDFGAFLSC